MGTLGLNRPGREVEHTSQSSAQVKNAGSFTLPHIRLKGSEQLYV